MVTSNKKRVQSQQKQVSKRQRKSGLADKDIPINLLERLASGQKAKMDKKQMKELTSKNYSKLPEIVKKREEEKKQKELQQKKERQ